MAVDQFAHSSPVWIGSAGSTDPAAASRAAADLIKAIDFAAAEAREAYGDTPTPRLYARLAAAREKLEALLQRLEGVAHDSDDGVEIRGVPVVARRDDDSFGLIGTGSPGLSFVR